MSRGIDPRRMVNPGNDSNLNNEPNYKLLWNYLFLRLQTKYYVKVVSHSRTHTQPTMDLSVIKRSTIMTEFLQVLTMILSEEMKNL